MPKSAALRSKQGLMPKDKHEKNESYAVKKAEKKTEKKKKKKK